MNQLGFPREYAQRSVVRHRRPGHPGLEGQDHRRAPKRQVLKYKKLYDRGVITEGERYNQVLDAWTHARERITAEMMVAMERRPGGLATSIRST
jgi:DNA-directed RNA polymerase beta' subunit